MSEVKQKTKPIQKIIFGSPGTGKSYRVREIANYYRRRFEYYIKSENTEEIKSRSIRKQFVYEYLIQRNENFLLKDFSRF
ncbi:ATP-binding protein [Microseira wollei]|uniref:GTPase subunit of Type II restriction endonuclease n=1 Tax=Microseira wollei NIES-4236 TaxID=2530354 RepID=A0AAV3X3H3_9CYAN|nr:ATP-binding protein [Microseira wollei]GET36335.1 GTPase subunit of Type II restriction endonuclease [Microseira wollei NIES-4236]